MKNLMFAALSIVSGLSKYKDEEGQSIKGMEIEKNSAYIIEGTYTNLNNFWGINVTGTGTEDYFYTMDSNEIESIEKGGQSVELKDLQEGDKMKVTYDGSVSLVYPPKLNHVTKIEVIEEKTEE